jgi:hypothetical protein
MTRPTNSNRSRAWFSGYLVCNRSEAAELRQKWNWLEQCIGQRAARTNWNWHWPTSAASGGKSETDIRQSWLVVKKHFVLEVMTLSAQAKKVPPAIAYSTAHYRHKNLPRITRAASHTPTVSVWVEKKDSSQLVSDTWTETRMFEFNFVYWTWIHYAWIPCFNFLCQWHVLFIL